MIRKYHNHKPQITDGKQKHTVVIFQYIIFWACKSVYFLRIRILTFWILWGCIDFTILSPKLVDYLNVQADNPWYNYNLIIDTDTCENLQIILKIV